MQLADPRLLAAIAAAIIAALGTFVYIRMRRITPEERERRRRLLVNQQPRTYEAFITEADADIIHFKYEFRGVEYFASQDVSSLRAHLPADPTRVIGPASVKFQPNNPANSILLCEEWSGLRQLVSSE